MAGCVATTDWEGQFGLAPNLLRGAMLVSGMYELEPVRLSARSRYVAFTDRTVTDIDAIVDIVRQVRAEGYAVSDEEYEIGLRSIAVPVPTATGGPTEVAMTVSVHASQVGEGELAERLLPALRRGAEELARLL